MFNGEVLTRGPGGFYINLMPESSRHKRRGDPGNPSLLNAPFRHGPQLMIVKVVGDVLEHARLKLDLR